MKLLSAPMGARVAGRRVWLRWVLLAAFVATLAFAFINLGNWQLDRLEQRRDRNSAVIVHENSPVVPFEAVFTRPITEADQWQRVRVQGTFDTRNQFVVRYRTNAGQAGYEVVTPLRTTSGEWVLVDRGFAPRPPAQDFPSAVAPPPAGAVSLVGYVRRDEQGSADAVSPSGNSIRLINSAALAQATGYPLVNGYVSLTEITPAAADGLSPVQPPALDEGNHFSYAIQWFMFAGIAGIGLILLVRSDVRELRRRAAAGS